MMKKKSIVELQVEGMTCTNCANAVNRFLERKGMKDVYVNFATHEVRYSESHKGTTKEDVKKGITKLGFSVVEEEREYRENFWTLEKKLLLAAILTTPLFFGHIFMLMNVHIAVLENPFVQLILTLPVYIIGCFYFGRSAYHALKNRHTNMDVLIFMGSSAAFIYSIIGLVLNNPNLIYFETAATIITLVLFGNYLEKRAVAKTTKAIDDLKDLQSKYAFKITEGGSIKKIESDLIQVGDLLQVNEGDAIPTDGIIDSGIGWVNESMLTGESDLVEKSKGMPVTGASILSSGTFVVKVTAVGKDTVLSTIINLVKNAQADAPNIQRLADRISTVFVPLVIFISILAFLIGHFIFGISLSQAIMNGIAVLVISCPCAMGLATPAAIMVGVGRAAKNGVLIKGSRTLELFADVKNVVFDKTGTMTEGKFSIKNMHIVEGDQQEIQAAVKGLESHSSHPIAKTLSQAFTGVVPINFLEVNEHKGVMISGKDEANHLWKIGSSRIVKSLTDNLNHDVYILKNGILVAFIDLEDQLKKGIADVVDYFNENNVQAVLLSGDKLEKVITVANYTNIQQFYAEKLPEEKYDIIEDLSNRDLTAMIGDGINDAAALAKADVGVTFSSASDVAVHSAGIVLLNDDAQTIQKAHQISQHTLLTIKQNLFWAFSYNIVAIPMAAMGLLNPMLAALFMAFSDIVVVGNSLRLRYKKM